MLKTGTDDLELQAVEEHMMGAAVRTECEGRPTVRLELQRSNPGGAKKVDPDQAPKEATTTGVLRGKHMIDRFTEKCRVLTK